MNNKQLIQDLMVATQEVIDTTENEFVPMEDAIFNHKPGKKVWSANECIEHLNVANDHYLREFTKVIGTVSSDETKINVVFKPGFWGNYFVKMITPREGGRIGNKMKTLRGFEPEGKSKEAVLQQFITGQQALMRHLKEAEYADLNKANVVSAIGRILVFRLGDAFRFVVGHTQRHIIQAQRTLEVVKSMPTSQQV